MGYLKDLGKQVVADWDMERDIPLDEHGYALQKINPIDGSIATMDNTEKGDELYNLTNPYGHLIFAIGNGDDFFCMDYGVILDESDDLDYVVLHTVWNTETGHSIETASYRIMEAGTRNDIFAIADWVILETYKMLDTIHELGIEHDVKGWNQDPFYWYRQVVTLLIQYSDFTYNTFVRPDSIIFGEQWFDQSSPSFFEWLGKGVAK